MGPWRWPLYTDAPYHSRCCMLKNCSMAMTAKHRLKIWSLSLAMLTSPYEWKILKLKEKIQTNKHHLTKSSIWNIPHDIGSLTLCRHFNNCAQSFTGLKKYIKCKGEHFSHLCCMHVFIVTIKENFIKKKINSNGLIFWIQRLRKFWHNNCNCDQLTWP